jgi:hypothetical protein
MGQPSDPNGNSAKAEISLEPPRPGAARMRRYRRLRWQGAATISFVVGADASNA